MTLKTYTKKFEIEKYKYWLMICFHVFTFCKLSLSCVLELNEFPATMTLHISAQWLCSSLLPSIPVTMSTNSWRLKICSSLLPISSPDIRTKYLKMGKKKIILFSVKITQKISKWTANLIFLLSFKFVIFLALGEYISITFLWFPSKLIAVIHYLICTWTFTCYLHCI